MADSKHLVYVMKTAPYDGYAAQEGLDALLAAAAFAQQVSVLYIGDGVFQLLAEQAPTQHKSFAKMLQALAVYDVEDCFVHEPSLAARGVAETPLCLSPTLVNDREVHDLLASANHVLTF